MEELLKQLISKAASSGGEEWLRRCLQEDSLGSNENPDRSSSDSACAAFPLRSAEPSTSDVTNRRPLEEEKAPPLTVPAKRFRKEKTRFSPSQQSTKRRIKLSDAQRGSRASDKHRNRLQQFLLPTAKSAARSSTVKPATATRDSSADLKIVWILGNQLVSLARDRSTMRFKSDNLGFGNKVVVFWRGISGIRIQEIYSLCCSFSLTWPMPDLIILHIGMDDLGRTSTHLLLKDMQDTFSKIQTLLPYSQIAFSEIIPNWDWNSTQLSFMEKIRIRINRNIEKYMQSHNKLSYRHIELEGFTAGLYNLEKDSLSDLGLDIFNVGLQNLVEKGCGVN
ncbi:uncharacterized protein LOC122936076 [Bufo gargarizans]|uniref:uncharacterized protein LOC122928068 n=1 Tax=Bufo gargarizans TaxID=30331 RepID=UPI001CF47890|nr:uncharacterized protein LOC122928068 [Bufo gargarizans]XP_044148011.1 uncharacterized protein LOC122936076 [Bufo gargarizans]